MKLYTGACEGSVCACMLPDPTSNANFAWDEKCLSPLLASIYTTVQDNLCTFGMADLKPRASNEIVELVELK